MSLTKKITFYPLFILVFLRAAISSETNQDFNLTEIAENNYVHLGKHVSIEDKENSDIANIGFIIGNDCVAVIDTGGSINIGMKLKNSAHKITKKPICYVINTHVHFDHILGNKAFVSKNTNFVGHKDLAEAVNQNRDFFLTPFPKSHSHNDLVVIDNETRTLWSGDLIFRERIPSLTGSLKGWLETIEKIKKLDVKIVVPGHGDVASSLGDAIKQQENYLNLLLNKTRQAINEGKFINEAMETIDQDNQFKLILHDYQHSTNINKAYTELEWE